MISINHQYYLLLFINVNKVFREQQLTLSNSPLQYPSEDTKSLLNRSGAEAEKNEQI